KDINPDLDLVTVEDYMTEENVSTILGALFHGIDLFVVDAIDTLSPKIALIQHCLSAGIPMVSSMGAGAKLDATAVRVADISKTYECPLAHMLRKRLGRLGIRTGFPAVFSTEVPRKESIIIEETRNKKSQVGTISYLPTVFGCVCAQTAIRHIVGIG
ncbi:MAG: ThiF family adenylyltransferase, partial [Bacteroidales bacterium]|nr:ThiF family adenylyltransferase [Bacteroidales bacterium]